MITREKIAASLPTAIKKRTIFLFIRQQLYLLPGNWRCTGETEELFCSDVWLLLPPDTYATAARCLIHPDDLPGLLQQITDEQNLTLIRPEFRVITSYGAVLTLQSKDDFEAAAEPGFWQQLQATQASQLQQQASIKKEAEENTLKLKAFQYAEMAADTGIWYHNTSTYETYYSDGVFKIFGLAPQSLNAHPHTFTSFIHPDDKEAVITAFEKAYIQRLPFFLEYRLLLNNNEVKFVTQATKWFFSPKGEMVLSGTFVEITAAINAEKTLQGTESLLQLQQQLLAQTELHTDAATWSIDLLTRRINFSNNIYHLYGIKPAMGPISLNLLLKYVHPDDKAMVADANRKIIYEHAPPNIDFRIIKPDGKIYYLQQRGKMVVANDANLLMAGTIIDNTAAMLAATKLQKTKEQLSVQEAAAAQAGGMANVYSFIIDKYTSEITWSSNFHELLGFKKSVVQPSQRSLRSFVHPADQKLFSDNLNLLTTEGVETEFSFGIIRRSETRKVHAWFRKYKTDDSHLLIGTLQDKTEEVQLQQQLEHKQTMAKTLSDASLDQVMVCDLHHYILQWNKRCEEVHGIKEEDAIGKNLFDILPQLKTPEVLERIYRAQRGEMVYYDDTRSILTRGQQDVYLQPVKDEQEQVVAVLTIIHDKTKETELRQQLSDRLHFIEKLLEVSIDRIVVLDKNMKYLYWNKRAEEYYDLKKEQVLGKNILEIFPYYMNDPSFADLRLALKGETVHIPAATNLHSKKGYFETYLIPIKNEYNEVTAILWMVHDLMKEFQLQRQQKRSNEIISALNENYFELDGAYRLTYVNKHFEDFFNLKKETLLGKSLWDVFPEAKDTPFYHAVERAMQEGVSTQGEFAVQSRSMHLFASIAPTEEGIVVLFFDITEQKMKDAELNHYHQQWQQLIEHSPDMITRWSPDMHLLSANAAFYKALNTTAENCVGKSLDALGFAPDELAKYKTELTEVLEKKTPVVRQITLQDADGQKHYTYRLFPEFDTEGNINAIGTIATEDKEPAQSENLLQAILNASLAGIAIFAAVRNEKGEITDFEYKLVNKVVQNIAGGQHLIGAKYGELYPGIRQTGIFEEFVAVVETGIAADFEEHYETDGFKSWFRITAVKLGDGLVSSVEDITKRKQAEEETVKNLTLLQQTEELTATGSWEYEVNTGAFHWSEGMYQLFGIESGEEVRPEIYIQFSVEQDRPIAFRIAQKISQRFEPFEETMRIQNGDQVKTIRVKSTVKKDKDGKPDKVWGVDLDITEELQLQQQIIQRTKYAQAVMDASIDRIAIFDKKYRFIAWNKKSEELDGLKKESVIGKSVFEIFPGIKDDKDFIEAQEKALAGEYVYLPAKEGVHAKGFYEWFYVPLKDEAGNTYAVLNIIHDVGSMVKAQNELQQLNKTLERKNTELADKNEEITNFAFIASHDLKEPLRKIQTFTSLLLDKEVDALSENGIEILEKIQAASERMNLLIEDITILTKINVDKNKENGVDLNHILEEVKKDISDKLQQSGTLIQAGPLPSIRANAHQIFYLFENLVANSIKFQPEGGKPVITIKAETVEMAASTEKVAQKTLYHKISFQDNGIGFDPRFSKKIFIPFQRLHGNQEFSGTGMGLAICKKIMENHQGFIEVESKPGDGSVFYCYFPV